MKSIPTQREYLCHILHKRPGREKLYTDTEWYAASSKRELLSIIDTQYKLWGFTFVAFETSHECSVVPCHTKNK